MNKDNEPSVDATGTITEMPSAVKAIPFDEVPKAPLLFLIVQDSSAISRGTTYNINACGLQGTTRVANDGFVYLGSDEKNDIIVPNEEIGVGKRHLIIKYGVESKCYYMKDLGEGTGTFVKIEQSLELQQGYIISFSDTHMVINLRVNGKIQIKFLDGPKTDQTLYDD